MSKSSILTVALLFTVLLFTGGCASKLGGDDYSRSEARGAMQVQFATVESVRWVKIEGTKSPVGSVAGAVVGGVVGHSLGGRGNVASTVGAAVGAVAGGVGGSAVEEAVTRQRGVEITVRLDSGAYLAVVQGDGGENFQSGERVRLVGSGQAMRVTR